MRICIINHSVLAAAFKRLGHEVLDLRPGPGPRHLPGLLAEHGFTPDLVLEVEYLGPRTILLGLESVPCPVLFWAVDVHLNSWWHRYYGRQFDGVLCSQRLWTKRLRDMGLPRVEYMPWFGSRRPFVPWSERDKSLCLVGRVTDSRPVRKRMVEHLRDRFGLVHLDGLGVAEMQAAYDTTRLVPNESIFAEVNFRLFEAASSGCLVINQEVEGGVEHLFEPGREVLEFADIVHLDALVERMEADPAAAEAMARAAWERVQREHLPEHRATSILELARLWGAATPRGHRQYADAMLAVYRMVEAGMVDTPLDPALASWRPYVDSSPTFFSAALRALYHMGDTAEVGWLLREEITARRFEDSFAVNLAGWGAAMRLGDDALALAYWLRHLKATNRQSRGTPQGGMAFCMAWARECEWFHQELRPGCGFDERRGIPDSALECLKVAACIEPENEDCLRRMNTLMARQQGTSDFRLSLLSWLTLRAPDNWRMGLDLGLVNLAAMRLRQGLEELVLARSVAERQGVAGRFDSVLASRDPDGAVGEQLARVLGHSSATMPSK